MENSIQLFDFQGNQIRTFEKGREICFISSDLGKALGHSNINKVVADLDEDEKGITICDTPGGPQQMSYVTEPGMYGLVLVSRKDIAKEFKRWIKHEVLPAIRKTGSYSINEDLNFNNYDEIKHLDLQSMQEPLRQAIQFYEDLMLSCRADLVFLRRLERENFPGKTFTRGKRETPNTQLYLRQVANRYQFGIKIIGKEVVIQRGLWGIDRAM